MTAQTMLTPELHPDDLADLRRSGLSDQTIISMGCFSVEANAIRDRTGVDRLKVPGYGIPYLGLFDQTGQPYVRWRLREPIGKMRYTSGAGDDAQLYVPPALAALPESDLLIVTEGEKKAAKAVQEGLHCVAIQGVWNWCDSGYRAVEKLEGEGVSEDTEPLSTLMQMARGYRRVLVLGDSDLVVNHQARRGFELLAKSLALRGIRAALAFCPPAVADSSDGKAVKKQGLDDWLVADRSRAVRNILPLFYAAEVARDGIGDTYNALAFAEIATGQLAYSQGIWRYWNGSIWVTDDCGTRRSLVPKLAGIYRGKEDSLHSLLRKVTAPFAPMSNSNRPVEIDKWSAPVLIAIEELNDAARKIGNLRGIDAALALAQSQLRVPDDIWNRDPHLLAVKNGVVDLRTSAVIPFSADQWITRCAGASYEPSAASDLFREFLEQVQPDPEMRDYLQRLAGYCATGLANEQKFYSFVGGGANGKSSYIGLLMDVFGDYAVKGPLSLLAEQSPDKPRNDLAALQGARMVSISETPENLRLDEATVKAVTGQDVISARFLHREFFQFRPCFTPILDTNHHPQPRDPGEGIWRRLVVVPWTVMIPEAERDQHLRERLLKELPGILAWVIEGARLYLASGLPKLATLTGVTQSLRDSCDDLGRWMEAHIVQGPQFREQSSVLYRSFCLWNENEGNVYKISQRTFTQRLADRGFAAEKQHGKMFWPGLRIRQESDRFDALDDLMDIHTHSAVMPPSPVATTVIPTVVIKRIISKAELKLMPGGSCIV
jgi:putative DNA primase/helicase